MNKPTDEVLAEFNKGGIHFLAEKTIKEIRKDGENWLGVVVEIAILSDKVTAPDFSFSIINQRGHATLATDWAVYDREDTEQKVLGFTVWQRMPDGNPVPDIEPGLYMSFVDMCFYSGNEAIPENFEPDTFTKPGDGSKPTDLGWHLPSRFVDSFIDAMGKLNDAVLAGQMQESIIYTIDE
jgi:hypothetical protein